MACAVIVNRRHMNAKIGQNVKIIYPCNWFWSNSFGQKRTSYQTNQILSNQCQHSLPRYCWALYNDLTLSGDNNRNSVFHFPPFAALTWWDMRCDKGQGVGWAHTREILHHHLVMEGNISQDAFLGDAAADGREMHRPGHNGHCNLSVFTY